MTYRKFVNKIERTKKELIEKEKEEGLYENFGQKEVRNLKDQINVYKEKDKWIALKNFDEWCATYTGRE